MTAETPRPPKDSLYSLQPTSPLSAVILRKSKLRCPASACRCSTAVIFMATNLAGCGPPVQPSREEAPGRDDRPYPLEQDETPLALEVGVHGEHGRAGEVQHEVDDRAERQHAGLGENEGDQDGDGARDLDGLAHPRLARQAQYVEHPGVVEGGLAERVVPARRAAVACGHVDLEEDGGLAEVDRAQPGHPL